MGWENWMETNVYCSILKFSWAAPKALWMHLEQMELWCCHAEPFSCSPFLAVHFQSDERELAFKSAFNSEAENSSIDCCTYLITKRPKCVFVWMNILSHSAVFFPGALASHSLAQPWDDIMIKSQKESGGNGEPTEKLQSMERCVPGNKKTNGRTFCHLQQ